MGSATLQAAGDMPIIGSVINASSPWTCTAARVLRVFVIGLGVGMVWCGSASATLTPFQLQGYVPSTVSCAPDGSCTTAGSIPVDTNSYNGLMTTVLGGQATAMVTAGLPQNADPVNPWVGFGPETCSFGVGIMCLPPGFGVPQVSNISCQSAGDCTAVATYVDTAGNMDGVMFTETDGVWGTGVQAQVPASLTTVPAGENTQLRFVAVQCVSAGNCTAVANLNAYTFSGNPSTLPWDGEWEAEGAQRALVFTETNGAWSEGQLVPPPADTNPAYPGTSMDSLSCPAAGDCVAVGLYDPTDTGNDTFIATESGGVWEQGTTVLPPSEPEGAWGLRLNAVACTEVGDCTAVGGVNVVTSPQTSYPEPVAVSETNGVWAPATTLNVPANAWPIADGELPDIGLASTLTLLSCPSTDNCTAAGNYVDANGIPQGLFANESDGTWLTGVQAQLAADPGNYDTVSLTQLSCEAAGNCAATGQETEEDLNGQELSSISADADTGVLYTETGGVWGPAGVPELPANAAQAPPVVGAVSCSISNGCIAAGTYDATSDGSLAVGATPRSSAAGSANEPYVVVRTTTGWSRAVELTPPAPTRAQVLATIRALLTADRGAAAVREHKRFNGAVRSFTALEDGTIAVRWTHKVGHRSVLVARAGAKIAKPGTITLHIRTTDAGARLLRKSHTIEVTDEVIFTPVASAAVRASDRLTLSGTR